MRVGDPQSTRRHARPFAAVLLLLLTAVSLGLPAASRAEVAYHLAVGSYRNYTHAAEGLQTALEGLDSSFLIEEVDLDGRILFRVIGGPYLGRDLAERLRARARELGFATPWVLERTVRSGMTPPGGLGLDASTLGERTELPPRLGSPDDPAPVKAGGGAGVDSPVKPTTEHTLVNEAPPGYGLNSLHRPE